MDPEKPQIKTPPAPTVEPVVPDDGPEDMELTVPRKPAAAVNRAKDVFGEDAKNISKGVNSRESVFDRGAVFRTDS
jgi:hypothetical protein